MISPNISGISEDELRNLFPKTEMKDITLGFEDDRRSDGLVRLYRATTSVGELKELTSLKHF